ncbi:SGNH/GDSL hydrolase family protein [Tolypothrix sp. NIES-4075]|uniref:SGNH/GDSL hydrolase family protein n=1 Tax=Tolypothrix sp. NIES-4075 TaxID=2005459 RepID=UPI000B5C8972|nr:SGNH/GDSL hydrolase family protein [Tolypothrix sp. NIES-4075]
MRKKILLLAILAVFSFIMTTFAPSLSSVEKINQLYIFGDSLSDTGNIYRATGGVYPSSPPYFQGRYSNGLVWVEYLASGLKLTAKQSTNFAFGGATTGSSGMNGIPGLLAQVNNFTSSHPDINPNALYVLWAGANDYLYGSSNSTIPIENLSRAIELLSTAGAKKILVANIPDLGKLPATRYTANSNSLSESAIAHNQSLAKSFEVLNDKLGHDTQIIQLDVNSLYRQAITEPAKFGFTNVTNACLNNVAVCDHPDKFLFWDGIHPTTAGHRILAEVALKALKN